jgi:uncharacterized protein YbbK (DUF523 family)
MITKNIALNYKDRANKHLIQGLEKNSSLHLKKAIKIYTNLLQKKRFVHTAQDKYLIYLGLAIASAYPIYPLYKKEYVEQSLSYYKEALVELAKTNLSFETGVAACLLGLRVRFNGATQRMGGLMLFDLSLVAQALQGKIIPLCLELFAGMTIPRLPSQIVAHSEESPKIEIIDNTGKNITDTFYCGLEEIWEKVHRFSVSKYIGVNGSPSCAVDENYVGEIVPGTKSCFSSKKTQRTGLIGFTKPKNFILLTATEFKKNELPKTQ